MEGEGSESRDLWMSRLEAWRSSGKSLSAWAREQGLSRYALNYWKRRSEGKMRPGGAPKSPKAPSSTFIALKANPVAAGVPLELVVGGIRVVVPAGFDAETLVSVLRVLERRC